MYIHHPLNDRMDSFVSAWSVFFVRISWSPNKQSLYSVDAALSCRSLSICIFHPTQMQLLGVISWLVFAPSSHYASCIGRFLFFWIFASEQGEKVSYSRSKRYLPNVHAQMPFILCQWARSRVPYGRQNGFWIVSVPYIMRSCKIARAVLKYTSCQETFVRTLRNRWVKHFCVSRDLF